MGQLPGCLIPGCGPTADVAYHLTFLIRISGLLLTWCIQRKLLVACLGYCCFNFENRHTVYSFVDFGLKNSSFLLPYQRPSSSADCARAVQGLKRIGQSSRLHSKKIFLVGGCGFFATDVISEVVLGSFWLMLPGLGPNRSTKVFRWSFYWKLSSSLSLLSLWSTF